MSEETSVPNPAAEAAELARAVELLGGAHVLGAAMPEPLALHDRLAKGLPNRALKHFTGRCPRAAQDPAFPRVLALVPPPRKAPGARQPRRLSGPQSGQLFRVALVVAKAAPIFGGTEAADRWLVGPALGLGGRRPLDLLETPVGGSLVNDHLVRLAFGVYL